MSSNSSTPSPSSKPSSLTIITDFSIPYQLMHNPNLDMKESHLQTITTTTPSKFFTTDETSPLEPDCFTTMGEISISEASEKCPSPSGCGTFSRPGKTMGLRPKMKRPPMPKRRSEMNAFIKMEENIQEVFNFHKVTQDLSPSPIPNITRNPGNRHIDFMEFCTNIRSQMSSRYETPRTSIPYTPIHALLQERSASRMGSPIAFTPTVSLRA